MFLPKLLFEKNSILLLIRNLKFTLEGTCILKLIRHRSLSMSCLKTKTIIFFSLFTCRSNLVVEKLFIYRSMDHIVNTIILIYGLY